jgi:hypothetical protein
MYLVEHVAGTDFILHLFPFAPLLCGPFFSGAAYICGRVALILIYRAEGNAPTLA